MEDYNEMSEKKISKYNSGVAQIFRIDNLWKDSHKHSRMGKLDLWNWDLDRVWCELAGDFDKEDKQVTLFKELNDKIGKLKAALVSRNVKVSDFKDNYYQQLIEKELFLRRLQNELGKGSAYVDEDEDDWE